MKAGWHPWPNYLPPRFECGDIGNVAEILTLTEINCSPTNATSSLTLSLNRQNTVLNAGASIQATLTLTAASNTGSLTTFNCDVTLTGTQ